MLCIENLLFTDLITMVLAWCALSTTHTLIGQRSMRTVNGCVHSSSVMVCQTPGVLHIWLPFLERMMLNRALNSSKSFFSSFAVWAFSYSSFVLFQEKCVTASYIIFFLFTLSSWGGCIVFFFFLSFTSWLHKFYFHDAHFCCFCFFLCVVHL